MGIARAHLLGDLLGVAPDKVKNLVTIVTPIDFDTDTIQRLVKRLTSTEEDTFGNVGAYARELLSDAPHRQYVSFLTNRDPAFVSNFLRMEKWIFDSPDQAGEAFRQFLKDLYQQNKLVKGELVIGDRKVDLKQITMPVLNTFAEADHLVPPACSRKFTELTGSKDTLTLAYPTGHIGMFTSHRSQTEYTPRIASWLAERSGGKPAPERDAARDAARDKAKAPKGRGDGK